MEMPLGAKHHWGTRVVWGRNPIAQFKGLWPPTSTHSSALIGIWAKSCDLFLHLLRNYLFPHQTMSTTSLGQTGSANAITINNANGNVGIGTTTPSTALQVAGTITATGYAGLPKVVHTTYTAIASSSSATLADVVGFSAKITPASANSTILVYVSVAFGFEDDSYPYVTLTRKIGAGTASTIGSGTNATGNQINTFLSGTGTYTAGGPTRYRYHQASKEFLDSPATTSEITYQIKLACPYGTGGYINRQFDQSNTTFIQFPTSCITLKEVFNP